MAQVFVTSTTPSRQVVVVPQVTVESFVEADRPRASIAETVLEREPTYVLQANGPNVVVNVSVNTGRRGDRPAGDPQEPDEKPVRPGVELRGKAGNPPTPAGPT